MLTADYQRAVQLLLRLIPTVFVSEAFALKGGTAITLFMSPGSHRAEFENIANAEIWASVRSRPIATKQILREAWLKDLHARMYGAVWSWAGTYRRRQTNLGCPPFEIPTQMADSLAYADAWISQFRSGGMTADEVAVRCAHRLVYVRPFPNGNGR